MIRSAKLEQVLAALNGAKAGDLRNRLQYLATINFPPGLRFGRANRATYGFDEVFAVAAAFALARAGVAPATAAGIVADFWPEIARALVRVGRIGNWHRADAKPQTHEYLLATSERLPTVVRGAGDVRAPARSFAVAIGKLDQLELPQSIGAGAGALLDLDYLYRSMEAALAAAPDPVRESAIGAAFEEFDRLQAGGRSPGSPPASASAPQSVERPAWGFRLGEEDYYYTRAAEIADQAAALGDRTVVPDARTTVLLKYLQRPEPRENWKMNVGIGGIEFYYALAVLSSRAFGVQLGVPHTLVAGAAARLEDAGIDGVAALAAAIRDVAAKGRDYQVPG